MRLPISVIWVSSFGSVRHAYVRGTCIANVQLCDARTSLADPDWWKRNNEQQHGIKRPCARCVAILQTALESLE